MLATYRGEKVRPVILAASPDGAHVRGDAGEAGRRRGCAGLCQRHGRRSRPACSPSSPRETGSCRAPRLSRCLPPVRPLLKRLKIEVTYVVRSRRGGGGQGDGRRQAALSRKPTSGVMEAHVVGALAAIARKHGAPLSSTIPGRARSSRIRSRSASILCCTRLEISRRPQRCRLWRGRRLEGDDRPPQGRGLSLSRGQRCRPSMPGCSFAPAHPAAAHEGAPGIGAGDRRPVAGAGCGGDRLPSRARQPPAAGANRHLRLFSFIFKPAWISAPSPITSRSSSWASPGAGMKADRAGEVVVGAEGAAQFRPHLRHRRALRAPSRRARRDGSAVGATLPTRFRRKQGRLITSRHHHKKTGSSTMKK